MKMKSIQVAILTILYRSLSCAKSTVQDQQLQDQQLRDPPLQNQSGGSCSCWSWTCVTSALTNSWMRIMVALQKSVIPTFPRIFHIGLRMTVSSLTPDESRVLGRVALPAAKTVIAANQTSLCYPRWNGPRCARVGGWRGRGGNNASITKHHVIRLRAVGWRWNGGLESRKSTHVIVFPFLTRQADDMVWSLSLLD